MTGIEPELDWTPEDCGFASIGGVSVLVGMLNKSRFLPRKGKL
jgi:hypothetical protein